MYQLDARRALADRGRDTLYASRSYITHCEDPRDAGFEHIRLAREWPATRSEILPDQIGAGADESFVIDGDAALQPVGVGHSACHEEYVLNRARRSLVVV